MTVPSAPRRPGCLRRLMRGLLSLSVTVLVAGVALAGGAILHGSLATRAAMSDAPEPAPPLAVDLDTIALQDGFETARRFAGRFEPAQTVALAFEEGGRLDRLAVREGDRVVAGDVVARLDTRLLEAERTRLKAARAALAAQVELARRTDARRAELRKRGFASDQQADDSALALAQLEAREAEAEAAIAAIDVRLSKTALRAPFDGTVGARLLDTGAIAGPGAPVLSLLQDGPSRFRVGIDPALADRLAGTEGIVVETGQGAFPARLARTAPDLDPATQTLTVFLDVEEADLPARTTGEVTIPERVPARGAWLPLSALRQGPQGSWQIVTLARAETGAVAALEGVEIVSAEAERVFAIGTFADGTRFVASGVHRIVPGERLAVTDAAEAAP